MKHSVRIIHLKSGRMLLLCALTFVCCEMCPLLVLLHFIYTPDGGTSQTYFVVRVRFFHKAREVISMFCLLAALHLVVVSALSRPPRAPLPLRQRTRGIRVAAVIFHDILFVVLRDVSSRLKQVLVDYFSGGAMRWFLKHWCCPWVWENFFRDCEEIAETYFFYRVFPAVVVVVVVVAAAAAAVVERCARIEPSYTLKIMCTTGRP